LVDPEAFRALFLVYPIIFFIVKHVLKFKKKKKKEREKKREIKRERGMLVYAKRYLQLWHCAIFKA